MAKETLLESDIDAGQRLIEVLDNAGEPVDAALWFYFPDLRQWQLLISSHFLDAQDLTTAYTKLLIILMKETDIGNAISIGDIKILNKKDPLMNVLKHTSRTDRGINRMRMTSNMLNGVYVEDALIYRNA